MVSVNTNVLTFYNVECKEYLVGYTMLKFGSRWKIPLIFMFPVIFAHKKYRVKM
jgi:hypothetical protein